MAKIIENHHGRRLIKLSTDDIISIISDYQLVVPRFSTNENVRNFLDKVELFIPEDC